MRMVDRLLPHPVHYPATMALQPPRTARCPQSEDHMTPATPAPPTLPVHLGRYRIVSRLGEGGMGTVYLAQDPNINNRRVAVKVPRFEVPAPPEVVARFQR